MPLATFSCSFTLVAYLTGMLLLFITTLASPWSESNSEQPHQSKLTEREFFQERYNRTLTAYHKEKENPELAICYVLAAFEWAELALNSSERESTATSAIDVCRRFLSSSSHQAQANYYLALNLGQLAKTKWLGALRLVTEMEKRLHTARSLDHSLDNGGPDRALSRLYFQAPGWPTSVGNKDKAIRHAKNAIAAAPNYPGNRLSYLEILLDHNSYKEAKRQGGITSEVLKNARSELDSTYWSHSWKIWDKTWNTLRERLRKP
jgi:tetratricopeptide (TPR) repeat protein